MTNAPMTRGQRGRATGRAMIALAIVAIGVTVLLLVATPVYMGPGPMFSEPPRLWFVPVDVLFPLTCIGGVAFGLAWMIRIHRGDPEPDQHAWRYRSRDRRSIVPHMTRSQWSRLTAAGVMVLAVPAAALAILIAAPGSFRASLIEVLTGSLPIAPLIGVVGLIVGSAWLIRIARDEPEPDNRGWRYRRDR
jgi:hypothetical protein